jgi:phage/plasmid-associated DNA primase
MQMLFTLEVVYPMRAQDLRNPFTMGELYNRAFCICNDFSAESLDEKTTGTLKELTGRDLISAAVKYGDDIVFTNFSKILIVTNHALKTKTHDEPFYRRIVCVPFAYPVSP